MFVDNLERIPENMVPKRQVNIKEIIPISALETRGIDKIKKRIREEIDEMVATEDTTLKIDFDKDFDALNSPERIRKLLL